MLFPAIANLLPVFYFVFIDFFFQALCILSVLQDLRNLSKLSLLQGEKVTYAT